MRRLVLVVSSSIVAVVAVGLISLTWSQRAEDICREQAPETTSGFSMTWEWNEFAYVCDYRAPSEPPRRVGIVDAFHSGGSQRHRPDR